MSELTRVHHSLLSILDTQKKHQKNSIATNEGWCKVRDQMVEAMCERAAPESHQCVACPRVVKNIVLCNDCGPTTYLCIKCTETHHKFIHFHKPLLWTVSKLIIFTIFSRGDVSSYI